MPEAISTDCDQTLRGAISLVFPYSTTLLCLWHTNKNVQQYCKPRFDSKDPYEELFQAWLSIVRSRDISEYNNRLLQFSTEYSNISEHHTCVTYVKNTCLRPGRVESLVQAWTNKHLHFAISVTSRLVNIIIYLDYILTNYSVESSHALLKRYIDSYEELRTWLNNDEKKDKKAEEEAEAERIAAGGFGGVGKDLELPGVWTVL